LIGFRSSSIGDDEDEFNSGLEAEVSELSNAVVVSSVSEWCG